MRIVVFVTSCICLFVCLFVCLTVRFVLRYAYDSREELGVLRARENNRAHNCTVRCLQHPLKIERKLNVARFQIGIEKIYGSLSSYTYIGKTAVM